MPPNPGQRANRTSDTSTLTGGLPPPSTFTGPRYQVELPRYSRIQLGLNQTPLQYLRARIALGPQRQAPNNPHQDLDVLLRDAAFSRLPLSTLVATARYAYTLLTSAINRYFPEGSEHLFQDPGILKWHEQIRGWEGMVAAAWRVEEIRGTIVKLVAWRGDAEEEGKRRKGLMRRGWRDAGRIRRVWVEDGL